MLIRPITHYQEEVILFLRVAGRGRYQRQKQEQEPHRDLIQGAGDMRAMNSIQQGHLTFWLEQRTMP